MNELIQQARSFGLARLGAIIGVGMGVALALSFVVMRLGAPSYSVLYADLSFADAQRVSQALDAANIDYDLRDNGATATILAPRDEISALHVRLAGDGVVVGGGVGYELFDGNQTLGVTAFQQNITRLRALEGELSRTISSIAGVRSARVHLVLPERQLFSKDREQASASIVVDAPGGLDGRAVRAIVNLAASAAPGLAPGNVTVLDSAGQLLAAGARGDSDDALAGSIEDQKVAAEARIRRNVEEILARIVGRDNVRVEVAADMDFSRVTESAEIVDPDSQTVLSSVFVEESSNSADPSRGNGVTVANALPGSQTVSQTGDAATSNSLRTEETTNYEISKTVRNAVREEGLVVKRLSVAVALNSALAPGGDAAPRSAEEIARLESLVKSAIGFNAERGDQVSVIDMPFSVAAPAPAVAASTASSATALSRDDIMRLSEIAALAAIGAALVLFVLRPMLLGGSREAAAPLAPAPAQLGSTQSVASAALPYQTESALEQRIDLAQVEGQVKASSIRKVSEIVKAHTDESAGILRNWMREAS